MDFWILGKQTWTNQNGQMFTITDKPQFWHIDRQTDNIGHVGKNAHI
jgi:hypothetical protein